MDRRWAIGGGALALLLGAALGAWLLAARTVEPVDGTCPEGMTLDWDGARCIPEEEACNSWLEGAATRTLTCEARSPDGKGHLRISVAGSGAARVDVFDADGASLYGRRIPFSANVETALEGARGAWTLRVAYEDAKGAARIVLWG